MLHPIRVAALICIAGLQASAASDPVPVGVIVRVSGDVYLATGATEEKLEAEQSAGRIVYQNELIVCRNGGTAEVHLDGNDRPLTCHVNGKIDLRAHIAPAKLQKPAAETQPTSAVLEKYKRAGRERFRIASLLPRRRWCGDSGRSRDPLENTAPAARVQRHPPRCERKRTRPRRQRARR